MHVVVKTAAAQVGIENEGDFRVGSRVIQIARPVGVTKPRELENGIGRAGREAGAPQLLEESRRADRPLQQGLPGRGARALHVDHPL